MQGWRRALGRESASHSTETTAAERALSPWDTLQNKNTPDARNQEGDLIAVKSCNIACAT